MAALGSDRFTLKGDADWSRAELELNGTVVERRFERRNGNVKTIGDGYFRKPELAELFPVLLEEIEARRAVVCGENLREPLTRPIEAKIEAADTDLEAEGETGAAVE